MEKYVYSLIAAQEDEKKRIYYFLNHSFLKIKYFFLNETEYDMISENYFQLVNENFLNQQLLDPLGDSYRFEKSFRKCYSDNFNKNTFEKKYLPI